MKKILLLKILFLLTGFQLNAQILNSSFENWTFDSLQNENPVGWETNNLSYTNSIVKTSDSHSGNFAMKLNIPKDTMFVGFEGGEATAWVFNSPNIIRNSTIGLSFYVKCDILSDYASAFVLVYGRDGCGQCLGYWSTDTLIPTYSLIEIPFDLSKIDNNFHDSITVFFFTTSPTNSQGIALGSISLKIDDVKLIEEHVKTSDFMVYPNPTTDKIEITSKENIVSIELIDLQGRQVLSEIINSLNYTIDVSGLQNGQYLLKMRTKDKVLIEKIEKL